MSAEGNSGSSTLSAIRHRSNPVANSLIQAMWNISIVRHPESSDSVMSSFCKDIISGCMSPSGVRMMRHPHPRPAGINLSSFFQRPLPPAAMPRLLPAEHVRQAPAPIYKTWILSFLPFYFLVRRVLLI